MSLEKTPWEVRVGKEKRQKDKLEQRSINKLGTNKSNK